MANYFRRVWKYPSTNLLRFFSANHKNRHHHEHSLRTPLLVSCTRLGLSRYLISFVKVTSMSSMLLWQSKQDAALDLRI